MSLSKFIEFVNKQNYENEIDHDSWASCAIGRYAASVGVPEETMNSREVLEGHDPGPHATTIRHRPDLWENSEVTDLMEELEAQTVCIAEVQTDILAILADPELYHDNTGDTLDTYGDLQELLDEHI